MFPTSMNRQPAYSSPSRPEPSIRSTICTSDSAATSNLDLRRTFAVHALASGIPLARVQRWLGHRTRAMTIRYAQHAPEPHADDDAARVEASMVGVVNREAQAVQALLKVVEA